MTRWLRRGLGAIVLVVAALLLSRHLGDISVAQLRGAWTTMPSGAITGSLLFTATSFACLAAFEMLAVRRMAPGCMPDAVALRAGAVSHAIANTLGFHALTAAALRLQAYRRHGLGAADIARVTGTVLGCVASGVVVVTLAALAWLKPMVGGLLGLCVFLAWRVLVSRRRQQASAAGDAIRGLEWVPLLGLLEMIAAIAALYVLLPPGVAPPPAQFALLFVGAMLFGIASHVPGGLGVFEAAILAALPGAHAPRVLAALILFRGLYNLVPFALAVLTLGLGALRRAALSSTADTRGSPAAGAGTGEPARGRQWAGVRAPGSRR